MKTTYLNTDLVIDSQEDLQALLDELDDKVIILFHGPFSGTHRAVMELSYDSTAGPEEAVNGFCALIENLSPSAKKVWDTSDKRVMDIGIEAGESPRPFALEMSSSALRRVAALDGSLMISVYPMPESGELSRTKSKERS